MELFDSHVKKSRSITDLMASPDSVAEILEWSSDHSTPLMILGASGSTKTYTARTVLKELGYDIVYLSFLEKVSRTHVRDLFNASAGVTVYNFFSPRARASKTAYFLDDIEAASNIHKWVIDVFASKAPKHPVVFCCNSPYHKLIEGMKSNCTVVEFGKVSDNALQDWCKEANKIVRARVSKKLIQDVVRKANGDVRQLLLWMRFVYRSLSNGVRTASIRNSMDLAGNKHNVHGVLHDTKYLLNSCTTITEAERFYEKDKILFPRMIHENVYSGVNKREFRDKIELITTIANNIAFADVVRECINKHTDDTLHGYVSAMNCHSPSVVKNRFDRSVGKLRFPKLMTIRYQRSKNTQHLGCLNDSHRIGSHDLYIFGQVFNHIIVTKDYDKLLTLARNYNMSIFYFNFVNKNFQCDRSKVVKMVHTVSKRLKHSLERAEAVSTLATGER